jgi:phage-related protein
MLLRRLQQGEKLTLPYSRPMTVIGPRCHELRIPDQDVTWRIMYRVDSDAVIVADVFAKKTQATPQHVVDVCKKRLRDYDQATRRNDS